MMLYQDIANKINDYINNGMFLPGSRLPGVRCLSQQFEVSISTIVQAQQQLESRGLLEARPRSGYYVCSNPWLKLELPLPSQPELKPAFVNGQALVLQLTHLANQPDFMRLGAAVPDISFMSIRALQRSLGKIARHYEQFNANYAFPTGIPELRGQIARRMYLTGATVEPDEVLITNGCQESLMLALQTVAKSGDIIAIESPTFYGILQAIEAMGMKALEIPTDSQEGLSLAALELALEQWPVKACVLTPNFSNPLGSLMPDNKKQQLVALAHRHGLLLIEDDIYGDLGFSGKRPCSLLSFSEGNDGNVIYCSSFSKTISQGLRVGWMVLPRRYFQQAEYLKYVNNLATPSIPQLMVVDFLAQNGYERHLRQVQIQYSRQVSLFTHAISKYFPAGTRVSQPQGGFVLWVELSEDIDALKLSYHMLKHKVSIAPGQIFSATQKYRNCIRLNCAKSWSAELEKSLILLGKAI